MTEEAITKTAVEEALRLEGFIEGDLQKIILNAQHIQELPVHQQLIRVEHLKQTDIGKTIKLKPVDGDAYVTGRLNDLATFPNGYNENWLVIDGKFIRALYRDPVLVDDSSVEV